VLGTIIGVPLGEVAMTARSAADGIEPRVWRALRELVGTAEFYLRTRTSRAS